MAPSPSAAPSSKSPPHPAVDLDDPSSSSKSQNPNSSININPSPSIPSTMHQQQQQLPWLDDLSDDLQSISFGSSTDVTSSSSEATTSWTSVRAHGPSDACWEAIRRARLESGAGATLAMSDLRFLQKLGSGDIGNVYLVELKCAVACASFAAKVMDKKEVAGRNKEGRARTEREILEILDHPFLPTLYAAVDCGRWSCLLTEFCPGGDLHVLRQRQPERRFDETAVRCAR